MCASVGGPLVEQSVQISLDCILEQQVPCVVEVPHFLTHLQEQEPLGRGGAEGDLGLCIHYSTAHLSLPTPNTPGNQPLMMKHHNQEK